MGIIIYAFNSNAPQSYVLFSIWLTLVILLILLYAVFSSFTICYYSENLSNDCTLKRTADLTRQQNSISITSNLQYNIPCNFGLDKFDYGKPCTFGMDLNSSMIIYLYWDKLASGSDVQKVSSQFKCHSYFIGWERFLFCRVEWMNIAHFSVK